jgi:hypothetical protein
LAKIMWRPQPHRSPLASLIKMERQLQKTVARDPPRIARDARNARNANVVEQEIGDVVEEIVRWM